MSRILQFLSFYNIFLHVSSGTGTIFQQGGLVQRFPPGGLGQSPGGQRILATIFAN